MLSHLLKHVKRFCFLLEVDEDRRCYHRDGSWFVHACRQYRIARYKTPRSLRLKRATITLKWLDCRPPMTTWAFIPLWNSHRMVRNGGEQPNFLSTFYKSSLLTVSEACVRTTKARNRLRPCSWHFSCNNWVTNHFDRTAPASKSTCTATLEEQRRPRVWEDG